MLIINLSACQPQKETVVIEKIEPKEQPTKRYGPGDIGGGNGVGGQPLESFRVKFVTRPEYEEIKNLIPKLALKHERLAADFWHIIEDRTWFFVPVALDGIDSAIIGTHFNIDQLALQSKLELWFDSILFSKMNPKQRHQLIIHELVMGVRLMEFQDPTDECLSGAAVYWVRGKTEDYEMARKRCFTSAPLISPGKKLDLVDTDYANIRVLSIKLANDFDSIDAEELKLWLSNKGFRKY